MNQQPLPSYQSLCTEFYDLDKHNDSTESALVFYMKQAREAQGSVLEPMCGSGRFLIPMLQAGIDIEGFDASPHMLNALKEKYAKISATQASVWQQFVQDFSSDKRYQLIFVPYGSWGLMTKREDSKKGLEIMFNHLAPGGKFIVEIETVASAPRECGIWTRGVHTRADGSRIALNSLASYDPVTQMFTSLCRYESLVGTTTTAIETENFYQYLYQFDEMDALIKEAGFREIKKYSDYQKTESLDELAPLLIYECIK